MENGKKKNTKKQSGILALFADSSPLMFIVDRAAFLAVVNLCTLVCCLPVVTAGGALCAAYDVLAKWGELTYEKAFLRYFAAFREHLKRSFLPWLLTAVILAVLGGAWYMEFSHGLTDSFVSLAPLLLATCVLGFLLLWLFPLVTRNKDPFPALLRDALLNAIGRLGVSVVLFVIEAADVILLCELIPRSLTWVAVCLLWGYAPFMLLKSLLIRHVLGDDKKDTAEE